MVYAALLWGGKGEGGVLKEVVGGLDLGGMGCGNWGFITGHRVLGLEDLVLRLV